MTPNAQRGRSKGRKLRRLARAATAWLSSIAITVTPTLPAWGQAVDITASGGSGTNVTQSGSTATVTTSTVHGTTAFNQFDKFNIGAGQVGNVVQPAGTTALVNIINGGQSTIAGTLNAQIDQAGGPVVGGNHFYVNRDGFVVSSGGTINAGQLTMTTPTSDFQDSLNAEAASGVGGATTSLFLGNEPLNDASSIEIYGQINAKRLELRSGARMLLDGTITVDDPGASGLGAARPAVNSDGMAQATGVVVQNGVIRLVGKGEISARGKISARRGSKGGAVVGQSSGKLTLGGEIDVQAGPGSGNDSGSVIFFTESTANLEAATKIKAASTAGDGGVVALTAKGKATVRGAFETAGSSQAKRGSTVISALEIETDGSVVTKGGDLLLFADDPTQIAKPDNTVGRIHLKGTIDTTGTAKAGDLVLHGDRISNAPGLRLDADADGSANDGAIILIAQATDEARTAIPGLSDIPTVGRIADLETFVDIDDLSATIALQKATLDGGAVIVNALAENVNFLRPSDDELTAQQNVNNGVGQTAGTRFLEGLGDLGLTLGKTLLKRVPKVVLSAADLFDVDFSDASATVTLDNVAINASGDWTGQPLALINPPTIKTSADGTLSASGGLRDYWKFAPTNPITQVIALPKKVSDNVKTNGGIHVQSHATTKVDLGGSPFLAGLSIAVNETTSQVKLANSTLTSQGFVTVHSTATEDHKMGVTPIEKFGNTAALIVGVRKLTNQTLVLGSTLRANAGDIDIAARSGRAHRQDIKSDGGVDGIRVAAFNFSFATGLTEAAIGGGSTLRSSGRTDIAAETLYFAKRYDTNTAVGFGAPDTESGVLNLIDDAVSEKIISGGKKIVNFTKAKIRGEAGDEPTPDPKKKPSVGFGIAFDLQVDNDETFASLGGQYRDLTNDSAVTDLGAATIIADAAASVTATQRFATISEGGELFRRDVSSTTPINLPISRMAARLFGKSEEEIVGEFSELQMYSGSISFMGGETLAEIGKDAFVDSAGLDVLASTSYPELEPLTRLKDGAYDLYEAFGSFFVPSISSSPPSATQALFNIEDTLDPLENLTGFSSARAVAPTARSRDEDAKNQRFALGLSLTIFNTDNTTKAVIRDGATVLLSASDVNVTATSAATFLHLSNFPTKVPGQTEPANDSIGGALHFVRAANDTQAVIEDNTLISLPGNVNVKANTNILQGLMTHSGGGADEKSINGAIGIAVMEGDTVARIGGGASVEATAVTINAADKSYNVNTAGAMSTGSNKSIGISVGVNFANRQIYGGIGSGFDAPATGAPGNQVVKATSLNVDAKNEAIDIALSVAGAIAPEQGESDPALAEWLTSDDEFAKLIFESDKEAPNKKGSSGNVPAEKPRTGWAIAGAGALNLALGNKTLAEINTPSSVDLAGGVTAISATNRGVTAAATGALALGLDSTQDTNAIAGSISVAVDTRDITARIKSAKITSSTLTLSAKDEAVVVDIAIGGGGTQRGKNAVAGSVAVATLDGDTLAETDGAEIAADNLTVTATDTSVTVGIAGAAGLNFQTSKSTGVGLGVAVNTATRSNIVRLKPNSKITTGALTATSTSSNRIYAFAASGALGQRGFAGSLTVNTITGGSQLEIGALTDAQMILTANAVNLTVTESNQILAGGGSLALTGKDGVGGAIVVNTIKTTTKADLVNAKLQRRASSGAVSVTGTISADSKIWALVVAAAKGSKNALGLGAGSNVIDAIVNLSLKNTQISQAGAVTLGVTNTRAIASLSGGVGISGKGAGGGAVVLNLLNKNDAKVNLDNAKINATAGSFTVSAAANGSIRALAAGISVAGSSSVGVTGAANVITGTTGVSANGADIQGGATFEISARDDTVIDSLAGGAALSGKNGAGAAVAVNVISSDATVVAAGAKFSGLGDAKLTADNTAKIRSLAVGLGGSSKTTVAGSIAIGTISNDTKVDVDADLFDFDAGATIAANQTSTIEIASGAAAIGGSNAVGGAITVAHIGNQVIADLDATTLGTTGNVQLKAMDSATIDAKALGGAFSGQNGGAISLIYTQIGSPPDPRDPEPQPDAPLDVGSDKEAKPAAEGQAQAKAAVASTATAAAEAIDQAADAPPVGTFTPASDMADNVRARLRIDSGLVDLDGLTVTARRSANINSIAGAVALSGSSGAAGAIGVNLLLGSTDAELSLPATLAGVTHTIRTLRVDASQANTVNAVAIGGALAAGNFAGAGAILVNVTSGRTDAVLRSKSGTAAVRIPGHSATVVTSQFATVTSVAGVIAGSAGTGVGGAVSVNAPSDRFTAEINGIEIDATSRNIDGAPNGDPDAFTDLRADRFLTVNNTAVAGAAGAKAGFAGSAAITVVGGAIDTKLINSSIQALHHTQYTFSFLTQNATAGAIALGGTTGAGVGIAVNVNSSDTTTTIRNSRIVARQGIETFAFNDERFSTTAIGGAAAGKAALTGSAATNKSSGKTREVIEGSTLYASQLIRLNAYSGTTIGGKGGGSVDGKSINGSLAIGGKVGVGAAVTVNDTSRLIEVKVTDSRITSLGLGIGGGTVTGAGPDNGKRHKGILIEADGETKIALTTVTGGAAIVAGIGGIYTYNAMDDTSRVVLGDATGATTTVLNGDLDAAARSYIGAAPDAKTGPVRVSALMQNTLDAGAYVGGLGIGGGGLGVVTNFVGTEATVAVDAANIESDKDGISVISFLDTTIDSEIVGFGAGGLAVGGAIGVTELDTASVVAIRGSQLISRDTAADLLVIAEGTDSLTHYATGVGAGGTGVGGAVQVTTVGGRVSVGIDKLGTRKSKLTSANDLEVSADRMTTASGRAVSAAAGGNALAISANVTKIEGVVEASLNGETTATAEDDVEISSTAKQLVTGIAGAGAGALGGFGAGGGLDYVALAQSSKVTLGEKTTVQAGDDLSIFALSEDTVDSTVATIALGLGTLTGSLSLIDVGGAAERNAEANALLLQTTDTTKLDQSDSGKFVEKDKDGNPISPETAEENRLSAGNVAAMANGEDERQKANLRRQGVELARGPEIHGAKVTIGADAKISAQGDATIGAGAGVGVKQIAGGAGISAAFGANLGLAFATSNADATVSIGDRSVIGVDGDLRVVAVQTGLNETTTEQDDLNEQAGLIEATAFSGGGSVIAGFGAGFAKAKSTGDAKVTLGDGVKLEGSRTTPDDRSASTGLIAADRSGAVRTNVVNVTVGLGGAIGTAVATSEISGISEVSKTPGSTDLGRISVKNALVINAKDSTRADAEAIGVSGGILAGNGVTVTAKNTGTTKVDLRQVALFADELTLTNSSTASARAKAKGINAGAAAVGASVADASVKADVSTQVTGVFVGGTFKISSEFGKTNVLKDPGGTETEANSAAFAVSSAGGLLTGNGADADAVLDYDVSTTLGGGSFLTALEANSNASGTAQVEAKGKQGGLLAIGVVLADITSPRANTSLTVLDGANFTVTSALRLGVKNTPFYDLLAESGSGGLVSGAGADGDTDVQKAITSLSVGQGIYNADTVALSAENEIGFKGKVDSVNASIVGASGANIDTDVTTDTKLSLGQNAVIVGRDLSLKVRNAVKREEDGFNVNSGSGGALDVAAMDSDVRANLTTALDIADDALVSQSKRGGPDGKLSIGLVTDVLLVDRQDLDSGGVIPLPFGDSMIDVKAGDAKIDIGKAGIFAENDLEIYAGGNANIRSEVFTSAYGLAGAAGADAAAKYDAGHGIDIAEGAKIVGDNNVSLRVGYVGDTPQGVFVRGEARAFNRTAFPMVDGPDGVGAATTRSTMTIAKTAEVRATGDVQLFAIAGGRDVVGYGLGKDLYRDASAAIGSGLRAVVGGKSVSLDYEEEDVTDTSNDLITVNGLVRSGARNRRALILDSAGNLNNAALGYDDEMADGIDLTFNPGVSLALDLQGRIDELNGFLADAGLITDAEAKAAWEAELRILTQRKAAAAGVTGTQVVIGDVTAREGNIDLRADNVVGTATGKLVAPGDALIDIRSAFNGFHVINDLIIPAKEGGIVTFNGAVVAAANDIRQQAASTLGQPVSTLPVPAYTIESGANSDLPEIIVSTTGNKASITVEGDVSNLRGIARLVSNNSDLEIRGSVEALTPILAAPNGNFFLTSRTGIAQAGPTPRNQYKKTYFDIVQGSNAEIESPIGKLTLPIAGFAHEGYEVDLDGRQVKVTASFGPFGKVTIPAVGSYPSFDPIARADRTAPVEAKITGRNVFVVAEYLNINGLIEAGRPNYRVQIGSGIDAVIDSLVRKPGEEKRLLESPDILTAGVPTDSPFITSDVNVSYNFESGRIEIADMVVQGGLVDITGRILSTGGGTIRALDGFGQVDVDSSSRRGIELGRIDTGSSETPDRGLQGLVRITDTNQPIGGGRFLTTEYRRADRPGVGRVLEVRDNRSRTIVTDSAGNTTEVPTNFLGFSTSDAGRSALFRPVGQDYVVVQTEERVQEITNKVTEKYRFLGIGSGEEPERTVDKSTTSDITNVLKNAPYVVRNGDSGREAYRMSARRFSESEIFFEEKVDDQTNFLGLGDVIRTQESTKTTRVRYSHTIRADYPVTIEFAGSDRGELTVNAQRDVFLSDQIINQSGRTDIISTAGKLAASTPGVRLNTAFTILKADGGSISGFDGQALQLDQNANGLLGAYAAGSIKLRETRGDMLVGEVRAVSGGQGRPVELTAQGSIKGFDRNANVEGSDLTLTAETGNISGPDGLAPNLNIRTFGPDAGLTATANGDIALKAPTGDVPVRAILSRTGTIALGVDQGSIVDANPVETRDIRTEAQLVSLWRDELGLFGDTAVNERRAQQINAKVNAELALYRAYWGTRNASSDKAPFAYVEDADIKRSLLALENGEAAYANFLADRQARQAEWNAQNAFDPNYRPVLSAQQVADATRGISWTQEELQRALRADLVRRSASTQVRNEAPNMTAPGGIFLSAQRSIGSTAPSIKVLGDGDEDLSAADLVALAAAEQGDILSVSGRVFVAQRDDVNVAFTSVDARGEATGTLAAFAETGDVLIGGRTPITLDGVSSPNLTLIKSEGTLKQARSSTLTSGRTLILESGETGQIGGSNGQLRVKVLPGGSFDARAGEQISILAPDGDLPIASIFTRKTAGLTVFGAITDAIGSGAPRIVSDGLFLNGKSVGTPTRSLGYESTGDEPLVLFSSGDAYLKSEGDMRLRLGLLGGGGRLEAVGKVALVDPDLAPGTSARLAFGTDSALSIIAPGGIQATSLREADITGGTLILTIDGPITTERSALHTDIASLFHASNAPADQATPFRLRDTGDLTIINLSQNANPGSIVDIEIDGNMGLGQLRSAGAASLRSQGGALTSGIIMAPTTELLFKNGVRGVNILGEKLDARATDGGIDVAVTGLKDGASVPFQLGLIGTFDSGSVSVQSLGDIAAGPSSFVFAGGDGAVSLGGRDIRIEANVATLGKGTAELDASGSITMGPQGRLVSTDGLARIFGQGDLTLGQVEAETGILVNIDGALKTDGGPSRPRLITPGFANLTFGRQDTGGPLQTQIGRLLTEVKSGDLSIADEGQLTLRSILAAGNATVSSTGAMTIERVETGGTATLRAPNILGGTGTILSRSATLVASSADIGGTIPLALTLAPDTVLNVDAPGNVLITVPSGNVAVGTFLAGNDGALTAENGQILAGAFRAGNALDLNAASGIGPVDVRTPRLSATSTSGDIFLRGLDGPAPFGIDRVVAENGSVDIDAPGLPVALNDFGLVSAGLGNAVLRTGAIGLGGIISAPRGSVQLLSAGQVSLTRPDALISAFDTVSVTAQGGLTLPVLRADGLGGQTITVEANGPISTPVGDTMTRLTTPGTARLAGTQLQTGSGPLLTQLGGLRLFLDEGPVAVSNIGDLVFEGDLARGGNLNVATTGTLTVVAAAAGQSNVVDMVAGRSVVGTRATLRGKLRLTAPQIDLGATGDQVIEMADALGGDLDFKTTGRLTIETVTAKEGVRLEAGTDLLSTGGSITAPKTRLTADGSIGGKSGTFLAAFDDGPVDLAAGDRIALSDTLDDLQLGNVVVSGPAQITAANGALLAGKIDSKSTALTAKTGIGTDKLIFVNDGTVSAITDAGPLRMILGDEGGTTSSDKLTLTAAQTSGDGKIELIATGTDLTIAGSGVEGADGPVTINARRLVLNSAVQSGKGAIDIATKADLTMTGTSGHITAGQGRVKLDVGTNLALGIVTAGGTGDKTLDVDVDGEVTNAAGIIGARFIATGIGAHAHLELGESKIRGPLGLETRLVALDVLQERGDLHLNNQRSLELRSAETKAGDLEIFAGGPLTIHGAKAPSGRNLFLAGGALHAIDGAVIDADRIGLFAFGGNARNAFGAPLRLDTKPGATVSIFAKDSINLVETSGDLTLAYAISDFGDLRIDGPANVNAGLVGAQNTATLTAAGNLTVRRVGNARVQLADAVGLGLVRPDLYRTLEAKAPTALTLNAGAALAGGILAARDRIDLTGKSMTANLSDATPTDGLTVAATGPAGTAAAPVNIAVLGAAPTRTLTDPLAPAAGGVGDVPTTFNGRVTFDSLRIGGDGSTGSVTSGGTDVTVQNAIIDGDTRFAQRDFTLLTQRRFTALSNLDDVQLLTDDDGAVEFSVLNGTQLRTGMTIITQLEGGLTVREVVEAVLQESLTADTEIVETTFLVGEEKAGSARRILTVLSVTLRRPTGNVTIRLPLITASGPSVPGEPSPG